MKRPLPIKSSTDAEARRQERLERIRKRREERRAEREEERDIPEPMDIDYEPRLKTVDRTEISEKYDTADGTRR